jgi:hypothetical protein
LNLSPCTNYQKVFIIFRNNKITYNFQSWAFATFSPIRYSLFRYFNTFFRYRYSATFPKIAIRYSLFATATFVSSVLRTASILGLYIFGKRSTTLTLNHFKTDFNFIFNHILMLNLSVEPEPEPPPN